MITISKYNVTHQPDIDKMMEEIAIEFDEPIFSKLKNPAKLPDAYWVALNDNEIIGTIAVIAIEKEFAILKKMMLKKSFRGKAFGVSEILLKTSINWCNENNFKKIYLGTMNQFKAAQIFYEKNRFIKISKSELPQNFVNNPLDSIFYQLDL